MKNPVLPLVGLSVLALSSTLLRGASTNDVKLTKLDDRVRVEMGGQLFTEYIFKGGPRPYLYPVLAADGTQMNRDFPMKKDVPGEESDHPHHRSLWFTHGAVNGVDFWAEGNGKGLIVNESVKTSNDHGVGIIESHNRWVGPGDKLFCTDDTIVKFRQTPDGRMLDYEVTIHTPPGQPLVFGDTKEGSMAIRIPQWMTLAHTYQKKAGQTEGHIVNDSGVRDGATWGKRSEWVDYYAPKDGKVYGIAIFDHPKNPQHPTWWHVRDYGLFAANPFGQHDFEPALKNNPKAGDMTIPAGASVTFRYRFYFHMGDEKGGKVAEHFKDYAAGK